VPQSASFLSFNAITGSTRKQLTKNTDGSALEMNPLRVGDSALFSETVSLGASANVGNPPNVSKKINLKMWNVGEYVLIFYGLAKV
jgi:hypothetical protein